MAKPSLSEQLETAKTAHTTEYNRRLQLQNELQAAKLIITDEKEDNVRLRNELMSKSLEIARLEGIMQERNRADRAAAQAAKPQVMVPLEEHPAYRERHQGMDLAAHLSGYGDASDRREWFHRK